MYIAMLHNSPHVPYVLRKDKGGGSRARFAHYFELFTLLRFTNLSSGAFSQTYVNIFLYPCSCAGVVGGLDPPILKKFNLVEFSL